MQITSSQRRGSINPVGVGICKLTGTRGEFVKSHIIPRAFSDRIFGQTARVQLGQLGRLPILRRTSWYDDNIVTAEGEEILQRVDGAFVKEAEELGLTWRYFPFSDKAKQKPLDGEDIVSIELDHSRWDRVRLFSLSLLWRAAVSRRPEFSEIWLDPIALRKLTKIVRGEIGAHEFDFPTTLVLLTEQGQPQNMTPLRQRMTVPQLTIGLKAYIKIFRFYVDGLIFHIGQKTMDRELFRCWHGRVLGVDNPLSFVGRKYVGSWQMQNLEQLVQETERDTPGKLNQLFKVK